MTDTIRLHPDHGDHELRCVTHDCYHAFKRLNEASTAQRFSCLQFHVVRCVECHTFADLPTHHRSSPPAAAVPDPAADQLALF